jgi:ketosteroid isomerase-like protein
VAEEVCFAAICLGGNMNRIAATVIVVLIASSMFAGTRSVDENDLWSMEQAYWQYVQVNDLEHYRTLWNADFLGWPSVSPAPLRKAQITDWITAHTSKGETLKSFELEKLVMQVKDNYATTTYRMHATWVDKSGAGQPATTRIIHTWQRQPDGTWQIISGMSAPTNAEGR